MVKEYKSGINFYMNVPIHFTISQKSDEKKEWDELLMQMELKTKRSYESSNILRKELIFKPLKIKKSDEILGVNRYISDSALELKQQICFAIGLHSRQFSGYGRNKMNVLKKEFKEILEKSKIK